VPVCLAGAPALISGIGDKVEPLGPAHGLPPMAVVLVNPRLPLPTAQVYGALAAGPTSVAGQPPALPRSFLGLASLVDAVRIHGNDLERPAVALLPAIADIKAALAAQPGCRIAAMSGSGPTCFGIFADQAEAQNAAGALTRAYPRWWVVATQVVGGSERGPSNATNIGS
jgi:4-diphosphocytidyl-2-C-methyl-D-erythritol kinase